jgi:hypothetical protein
MKHLFYIIAALICLVSCEKDPEPVVEYCTDKIAFFKDHVNYEGYFNFCSGLPLPQSNIPAKASATFLDSNIVSFHLTADSIHLDTTLIYNFNCTIFPEIYLTLALVGQSRNDMGYFRPDSSEEDFTGYMHIDFGHPNCLTNAAFDGFSKP